MNSSATISWIGGCPNGNNNVAILIPQYNELTNGHNFGLRLNYFKGLAKQFRDVADTIIIDDGSTDGSLNAIKQFSLAHPQSFYACSISPNLNKVGALYRAILDIKHEFVILSDFDTDLAGLSNFFDSIPRMQGRSHSMGCYFRLLPFEGGGNVFLFQKMEYAIARAWYRLWRHVNIVPVMPGAGSCYKRCVLENIYGYHSGLRSGEDREATLLGHKLGYETFYISNVLALTRTPPSFRLLIKQRIRWNRGYVETFSKERVFYLKEIARLSMLGIRSAIDLGRVGLALILPVVILVLLLVQWQLAISGILIAYFLCILFSIVALVIAPSEFVEVRPTLIWSIIMYPIYKIPLDCICWPIAIRSLHNNGRGGLKQTATNHRQKNDP